MTAFRRRLIRSMYEEQPFYGCSCFCGIFRAYKNCVTSFRDDLRLIEEAHLIDSVALKDSDLICQTGLHCFPDIFRLALILHDDDEELRGIHVGGRETEAEVCELCGVQSVILTKSHGIPGRKGVLFADLTEYSCLKFPESDVISYPPARCQDNGCQNEDGSGGFGKDKEYVCSVSRA